MKQLITEELVQRISGDAGTWLDPLRYNCTNWSIDTWPRVSMFLAQCAHESAGFRRRVENLKYSPAGLLRTWPTRFSQVDAERMAYDEYAIAERAYGGRYGNGPEGSGDGYRYRGRGIIQLTFHDNYLAMGEHIGWDLVADPDQLVVPDWAIGASAAFWDVNKCSEAADAGDFERVTRIVNGGTTGYDDRLHCLDVIKEYAP
jgi:putative chitinase